MRRLFIILYSCQAQSLDRNLVTTGPAAAAGRDEDDGDGDGGGGGGGGDGGG